MPDRSCPPDAACFPVGMVHCIGMWFGGCPTSVTKGQDRRPGEAALIDAIRSGVIDKMPISILHAVARRMWVMAGPWTVRRHWCAARAKFFSSGHGVCRLATWQEVVAESVPLLRRALRCGQVSRAGDGGGPEWYRVRLRPTGSDWPAPARCPECCRV